jgi:hypothetical protein
MINSSDEICISGLRPVGRDDWLYLGRDGGSRNLPLQLCNFGSVLKLKGSHPLEYGSEVSDDYSGQALAGLVPSLGAKAVKR